VEDKVNKVRMAKTEREGIEEKEEEKKKEFKNQ